MPSMRIIICTLILISTFLYILADKEEVPNEHPQHHSRSNFEQKHMGAGQHDPEMDHKAILGTYLFISY